MYGVACAGGAGVIFDPRGNITRAYECDLGVGTNNYAKTYSLYLGIKMSLSMDMHSLTVIGDSLIVLSQSRRGKEICNKIFGCLHNSILSLITQF